MSKKAVNSKGVAPFSFIYTCNNASSIKRSKDPWDLPSGVYVVGVEKADPDSNDPSCRAWKRTKADGTIEIVAVEHKNEASNIKRSKDPWDLPSGVYVVGVEKADPDSNDPSCRAWTRTKADGTIEIVAVEYKDELC